MVTTTAGKKLLFELPPAAPAGFSLAVNNQLNDSIYLKVTANADLLKAQANKVFYVVGQRGADICYTAKGELKDAALGLHVAKNRLPSGVLKFTVFAENGKPLNSRMIFNENTDTLNVITERQPQGPINILVKDLNGKPVNGSFGVAITRESAAMADIAENDILAYMQLTGELKDEVEQPGYYFNKENKDTKAAMDMLLITQENKKYNWRDILANADVKTNNSVESALSLEGFVKDKKNQPLAGAKVWVYCIAQHFEIDTLTDNNGHFKFNDLELADTANLIIKAESKITRKLNIYVKEAGFPSVSKTDDVLVVPNGMEVVDNNTQTIAALSLPQQAAVDTERVYKSLKQVDIKSTKIAEPSFFNNYGMRPTYTLYADMLQDNGPNLAKTLARKIPGTVYINGKIAMTNPTVAFAIVIDGRLIKNEQLDNYLGPEDVQDIKMLEGVTPTSVTGVTAGKLPPILMITTKRYAHTAPPEARQIKTVAIATDTSGRSMIVTMQPKKVLKTVDVKSKKVTRDDASNNYGASFPYTITGDVLKELGSSVKNGLLIKVPFAMQGKNGNIGYLPRSARVKPGETVPIHIVINNHEVPPDEIDMNVGADDIEDVRVLHGQQYKTAYGVPIDERYKDEDDILLITTKRFAGTYKPEPKKIKTVVMSASTDTGKRAILTTNTKKIKVLKEVDIKANKNEKEDIAPGAYTVKGSALKDAGATLMEALIAKLPFIRLEYDKVEMVSYFASFKQVPATIDNPNPKFAPLHVVVNNIVLLPSLSLDAYVNVEDVEEVKILHGSLYKIMFNIPIDPKLYDMDDIILITTKPGAGHLAVQKKQSQIQNESYITTAEPSSILSYKFTGYSTAHQFNQQANLAQLGINPKQPKTVFWQPNMITDADGKLTINLDDKPKGTYRVTVQGIDSYGRTGRLVYTYKVE